MRFSRAGLICACCACTGMGVPNGCGKTLKDAFKDHFTIGGTLGSRKTSLPYIFPMREDPRELKVLAREFNCVTAENLMKWEFIHPAPGRFNFKQTDEFIAFAEKHTMAVAGHVLIWHAQTPEWVFQDEAENPVSRETLIERMREHIYTVVGRYKGRVKYWDVVNEAIDTRMVDDDSQPPRKKRIVFYRNSPWQKIIGNDYIELAFRFAHEADPDARLLYNDYSMTDRKKAEMAVKMIRRLKAKKIPIHGVGMQGHWHLEYPSTEKLRAAIDRYAAEGIKVSITELDIGVLPLAHEHRGADISRRAKAMERLNPYIHKVPLRILQQQAEKYRTVFEVLMSRREHIERVTFWGVSDKYSWLNNYPVPGRTAHPLLFDRDFQLKPAYRAIMELSCAR